MKVKVKVSVMRLALAVGIALFGLSSDRASGQHLFLDQNGDAVSTSSDMMADAVVVDVWIQTDRHRDGSGVTKPPGNRPLTINSYEFVLKVDGGTVEWGQYSNIQKSMDVLIGSAMSETEFYIGYGGLVALPPGKHKLGTLSLRTKSGSPRVQFASSSSLITGVGTSFGSQYSGKDRDNTLKFTEDHTKIGAAEIGVGGDWGDATGLKARTGSMAEPQLATAPVRFAVSVSPNPAKGHASVQIQTTKAGKIRVRIYDVSGRLIRTIMDSVSVPPGTYVANLATGRGRGSLASGVYVYRVETEEKTVSGRLVVLK